MVDDRDERLIHRNHLLLALAAKARADARETAARTRDRIAINRRSRLALAHTLFRLQHPRVDSSPSADALFCC